MRWALLVSSHSFGYICFPSGRIFITLIENEIMSRRSDERLTYLAATGGWAWLGMRLLIWSIATSYSGTLIDKLASLNVAWTFYSRGAASLTVRSRFIALGL